MKTFHFYHIKSIYLPFINDLQIYYKSIALETKHKQKIRVNKTVFFSSAKTVFFSSNKLNYSVTN